jgi:hypothetical protein
MNTPFRCAFLVIPDMTNSIMHRINFNSVPGSVMNSRGLYILRGSESNVTLKTKEVNGYDIGLLNIKLNLWDVNESPVWIVSEISLLV